MTGSAAERVLRLREQIDRANHAYYILDAPEISGKLMAPVAGAAAHLAPVAGVALAGDLRAIAISTLIATPPQAAPASARAPRECPRLLDSRPSATRSSNG